MLILGTAFRNSIRSITDTVNVRMQHRILLTLLLTAISSPWPAAHGDSAGELAGSTCLQCHAAKRDEFSASHSFAASNCVSCHAGDSKAATEAGAHLDLIAFPGELNNAERACGSCHAARVASVKSNLMHTGRGIVAVTRQLIDGGSGDDETVNFQSLGHGVADSMLRKLCASCHLGQAKAEHRLDVMGDRGGGCLACHVNDYPENGHPPLTASVSDARCFGCHARSGRISLSYTGFAEVEDSMQAGEHSGLRLPDGRHVERKAADVHYLAGMACIDCHTSIGLMGAAGEAKHQRQSVDIACTDCHDNNGKLISLDEWPTSMAFFRQRLAFVTDDGAKFMTTAKNKTPLWNIELRTDGAWLHTKNSGRVLKIPGLDAANHAGDPDHERLECATCHSQWAPQCFGCHMEYDADSPQWDHVEQRETAGRWNEQRSQVRNELGTLGVNEENRIELFVPGMIMTVAHPDWDDDKFIRVFAPLSPHTTGASRNCRSCHDSSEALGLGQGEIVKESGQYNFNPGHERLQDGLPGDAWTNLDSSLGGRTPVQDQRPLNKDEIKAILDAPVR